MSNTMNVSYMSRVYNNFINNYETKSESKSATTFGDKVTEKRGGGCNGFGNTKRRHCFHRGYDNGRI